MSKKNIVVIGFMTAGKSKVSRLLSNSLGWPRLSTDEIIESLEGCAIKEIFASKGEKYFRELERNVVKQVSLEKNVIIDCGGGVVLNKENISDLKSSGEMFYLKVSAQTVLDRLKLKSRKAKRPLLDVEDPLSVIKDLMKKRESLYSNAHHILDSNSGDIESLAKKILKTMKL